jgi:hypothetical protein
LHFTCVLLACGPTPGDGATAGEASTGGGEPTGGAASPWSIDLPGCGGAYGLVVLAGGDLLVVGERAPDAAAPELPWAARYTADGAEVWSLELAEVTDGGFTAVDRAGDAAIAVGHVTVDGAIQPLLARIDVDAGAVLWTRAGEPDGESAMYGATWSQGQQVLWATGSRDGGLALARYDGDGALAGTFAGPGGGFGVGFAVGLAGADVVVCGRSPALEGGRAWLGRYRADGELLWSAEGPDPGVGAFSDCWDMAVGTGEVIAFVEAGYKGARIAGHAGDGALLWEHAEPDAGAQAVAASPGGGFWVAGWSAARSHGAGERHGWLRRYDDAGAEQQRAWLELKHVSPRDVQVHPDGGVALAGERVLPEAACAAPWLARRP